MKKITLMLFLISGFCFAQQQSYLDAEAVITTNQDLDALAIIKRVDNGRQLIVDTYTTLTDFENALTANCSSTAVIFEDMLNGPGAITACGPTVSSAGDGCYTAGELQDGFNAQASTGTDVVSIPAGAIGNIDPLIGAATFTEYTIINFSPDVYAVSMDIWENIDPLTIVRVFGTGGALIEVYNVTIPINAQTFFGVIADEPITAIELRGDNNSGELFGNFRYGGDCSLSINTSELSNISVFINSDTNILNVRVPSNIQIERASIFDISGKEIKTQLINGQINIQKLSNGIYILKLQTSSGTLTQKIVKR